MTVLNYYSNVPITALVTECAISKLANVLAMITLLVKIAPNNSLTVPTNVQATVSVISKQANVLVKKITMELTVLNY
jgi:hypothetical protein